MKDEEKLEFAKLARLTDSDIRDAQNSVLIANGKEDLVIKNDED